MKFDNFLRNVVDKYESVPTCHKDLDALEVLNNIPTIDQGKCIGCLSCITSSDAALTNPISHNNEIINLLFDGNTEIYKIKNALKIFSGKRVILPGYSTLERRHGSFEDFTSINETEHIALWVLSAIKFLSSKKPIIGKEIEIANSSNPRDGRLDVCAKCNSKVLVLETKTTFSSLMRENRYRIQIPEYYEECNKVIRSYNEEDAPLHLLLYLVIGGPETDLYPPDHNECTQRVGDKSSEFYAEIVQNNIKFISANAIWVLVLHSILNGKKICWDLLFPKLFFNNNVVGLLTAGIVIKQNENFVIQPIVDELFLSSATSLI